MPAVITDNLGAQEMKQNGDSDAAAALGTLLSSLLYQWAGVNASLWGAVVFAAIAGLVALFLPPVSRSAMASSKALGPLDW